MRLTLMVLSILRVLPVARVSFILVLAASFLAAGSPRVHAVEVREHKKTVPVDKAHKTPRPARKRTSVSASHNRSHTAARRTGAPHHSTRGQSAAAQASAHRRSARSRSAVVRTTTRTRSGRRVYHYSTRKHRSSVRTEDIAARPRSSSVKSATLAGSAPGSGVGADAPEASATSLFGGKIVAMAPLRGSLESLVRQNERTDADNLERILNDDDLRDRIAQGVLVPVPTSAGLTINPNLPADRRYCRPWTATFLTDLARAYEARFHTALELSSAVRTVEYQKHLRRTNGNAAPAQGDVASPHLTGATIDLAKSGLTRHELYWMRNTLNTLQAQGKIDVEEEFRQSCFHITVYKSYIGAEPPHRLRKDLAPPSPDDSDDDASPAEAAAHN